MKNVLFLGESPGRSWRDGSVPVGGRNARRLGALLGMCGPAFLQRFSTANVLDTIDEFPMTEARRAARRMDFSRYDLVVMLGRKVQQALGFPGMAWFGVVERDGTQFLAFPHPSGRNRWWNDPDNVDTAAEVLRSEIKLLAP